MSSLFPLHFFPSRLQREPRSWHQWQGSLTCFTLVLSRLWMRIQNWLWEEWKNKETWVWRNLWRLSPTFDSWSAAAATSKIAYSWLSKCSSLFEQTEPFPSEFWYGDSSSIMPSLSKPFFEIRRSTGHTRSNVDRASRFEISLTLTVFHFNLQGYTESRNGSSLPSTFHHITKLVVATIPNNPNT
jgi:hypothetical protein